MILTHYYKGERLTKAKTRFDIVSSYGEYKPFETLLKNIIGINRDGLSFHFSSRPFSWKGDDIDMTITKSKKHNITSIRRPDLKSELGYGDIYGTKDACIIKLNNLHGKDGVTSIEVFIARGMKNDVRALFQIFKEGELEAEIKFLHEHAKNRFDDLGCFDKFQ